MPFFLDSNVLIGFYFSCADQWGNQAKKVIEKTGVKHSSTTVWHECFGDGGAGKCRTIFYEIKDEFRAAINLLTKENYPPTELFCLAVAEKWKTLEIFQELVGKYQHDTKELVRKIRKAEWKYESDCDTRLAQLRKPAVLQIHSRVNEYLATKRHLDTMIEDPSDVVIVLDAHHVGGIIQDLNFVTGDHNHIVRHRDFIVQHTNISDVTFLDYV
ncbi:MAG: hypothetical protein LUQ66_03785 [Methanoregula sp.]|nr:hypothetical protein [Methanoregula sp.]